MAAPFNDWKLEDVKEAIGEAIDELAGGEESFETNAAFVEDHDHWQNGETWVGPNGGSDMAVRTSVLSAVERQFTPRDVISEILDRVANALLKREPDIDFIPLEPVEDAEIPEDATAEESDALRADVEKRREAQRAAAAEMKRAVSAWWDRKKLWPLSRQATKRSRWAGRGPLRTWIAPGNLEEVKVTAPLAADDGDTDEAKDKQEPSTVRLPTGLEFMDAIMRVELSAPRPDVARVHTDPETQQKCALFTYHDDDADIDKAEMWYVEGGKTVLRVVADGYADQTYPVDLGGRLPIAEMEAELLITEPVRRQQNRVNFHESVLVRVGEVAGFPERYTLNAEPSGIWLDSPPAGTPPLDTQVHQNRTYYLHPAPRTLGSAITTDLRGMIMKTGNDESRATPGVVFKEPTDPEYAIKAARHAYFTMLEQCKQGHLANDSTAEASGVAYEQARADYEADLEAVRGPLEGMIREIIEVVIAWAEAMSSAQAEGSFLEHYRVSVTLKVNAGPITPDQRNQLNADVKAGTLSRASAMAAAGIEDVDAETQKILADPAALVELRRSQIEAITALRGEGMGWERSARLVGIDDPELLRMFRDQDEEAEAEAEAERIRQEQEQGAGDEDDITRALKGTGAARQPAAAGAGA